VVSWRVIEQERRPREFAREILDAEAAAGRACREELLEAVPEHLRGIVLDHLRTADAVETCAHARQIASASSRAARRAMLAAVPDELRPEVRRMVELAFGGRPGSGEAYAPRTEDTPAGENWPEADSGPAAEGPEEAVDGQA
jgi:hypothetical protein